MKKLSVILVHCIIFAILLNNVLVKANGNGTIISLSSSQICVGDEFIVTVCFNSDYQFYGLSAIINYDSSVFEYISGIGIDGNGTLKIVESPSGVNKYSCNLVFRAKISTASMIWVSNAQIAVLGNNGAESLNISGSSLIISVREFLSNALSFEYDNKTFSLLICGNGKIPDFYSASETPWYSYNDKILSVRIEDGVTTVGNNAFSRMTSLKTVSLPESIVEIGESAFSDCPLLETVNVPSGVEEINYKTFYNCRSLKNIDISNVISIGDYAFYRCSALENVRLSNAKYIGNFAFNKCTMLKEIEFSDTLSHIGESAFAGCSQLKKADLPKSVIYVDETAFDGCDNLNVKGDLNDDKRITAEDLTVIRKSLLGITEINTKLSDINDDGNFNVIDLIYLKKIVA